MNKLATSFLFCFIAISGMTGCRIFRPRSPSPVPDTPPVYADSTSSKTEQQIARENEQRIKTKAEIFKELVELRIKIGETDKKIASERAKGKDTGKAEEAFNKLGYLFAEAERLYLEANLTENYEPVLGLLQAVEDSFKTIENELKNAPRFRDARRPQPREYLDDRDKVFEQIGHISPVRIQIGPMFSFRFPIFNPTGFLDRKCFDGRDFYLNAPPKVWIGEFDKGQEGLYQFVLIENNPYIDRFSLQASLSPEQRDQALSMLCQSQGSNYENYRFLASYKNAPVVSPEFYLQQLLSGQFRFADQFGLGALTETAKGSAGLADLELVSLVFSTKITELNKNYLDTWTRVYEKIKNDLDAPGAEELQQAFVKVESWENTMRPGRNEKRDFLRLLSNHPEIKEIEDLVNKYENYLKEFAGEFQRIQKELLRFKRDYENSELTFFDDQNPVMVLLMRGVRFKVEEESAQTLFKKDIPEITVEVEVFYYRSKNDEKPLSVSTTSSKITTANKYFDVSKDYQRLTSFMLGWPLRQVIPPGHYRMKLTITDQLKEEAVIQEVNFTVISAELRR